MQTTISDKITIVVPCKNEENYIAHLLMHLRQQSIGNTRIIIADCSTDKTREVIEIMKGELNVEIIDGGPVSLAKNNGAQLVTTPYILFIDPFAVGAFMLTRRDRFEEFGGFPEQFSTSEDFFLSRKYSPKKFRIIRHHFGQDSRRFKRMGYMGMAKYLVKNFVNRNNKAYWDKLDSSKYWS